MRTYTVNSPLSGQHTVRATDGMTAVQKVARKDGLSTRRGVSGWTGVSQVISGHRYSATLAA